MGERGGGGEGAREGKREGEKKKESGRARPHLPLSTASHHHPAQERFFARKYFEKIASNSQFLAYKMKNGYA